VSSLLKNENRSNGHIKMRVYSISSITRMTSENA